jgi:pyridoxal phosphate enzyme (YggS family)
MVNEEKYLELRRKLDIQNITLVAVSKTKPAAAISALYELGQRDFGENYVQELVEKQGGLPDDIRWHFIGHLQRNKVKEIAPFVHLIHGVDSFRLLTEINRQGEKCSRIIDVLLQVHIAEEETKYGLDAKEIIEFMQYYDARRNALMHVRICGVMGIATDTEATVQIKAEFDQLQAIFRNLQQSDFLGKSYFNICSMGMSGDYPIAIAAGSNMVRIGSLLFGSRSYT